MGKTLGVGIAGYGSAGHLFHGRIIRDVAGLEVRACSTRNEVRASRVRVDHPGADVVPSPLDLLARDDIDLIVVATPNLEHVRIARLALDAGKHVVVDKPMATNLRDAHALAEAAARSGLRFSVYHNRRWDGDFLTLQELVTSGRLGRPQELESRFEYQSVPVEGAWRLDPENMGDPLLDIGPHLVDQALLLFGEVTRVYCEMDALRAGASTPDAVFLALTHRQGVRTRLHVATTVSTPRPRFRLRGLSGEYIKSHLDSQERQLMEGRTPSSPGWGQDNEERWGKIYWSDGRIETVPSRTGSYQAFYEQMRDAIWGTASVPVEPTLPISGLRVLDAARVSASQGLPVELTAEPVTPRISD